MCPGLIEVHEKTDLSPHCSLRIEYVVGVRKALFNINYDFGKPPNYMLAPHTWKIFLIMPEFKNMLLTIKYVYISFSAHR